MRRAFTRISEHLLRIYYALIAHVALCPPILAKYQGAPLVVVHSCALVHYDLGAPEASGPRLRMEARGGDAQEHMNAQGITGNA